MAKYQWTIFLFLVAIFLLAATTPSAAQALTCSTYTGCTCEISNTTDINFKKLFKKRIQVQDPTEEKYYYVLSLCEPISCTNGKDDVVSAVCQFNNNKTDLEPTSLGAVESVKWTLNDENDFTLLFSGGDKAQPENYDRTATFAITIDKTVKKTDISFVQEETDDKGKVYNYKFAMTLTERDAFGGGGSSGAKDLPIGYVGLTLIIVGVIAVVLYFVIGAIVNSKVKGAGGTEVVPCVGFWKELPFLIKDGCAFTLSPCKALYNKRGGSYKSLN